MSKAKPYSFDIMHLVYVLALAIPIGVTWGVYSNKINNLTDRVMEVRAENDAIKLEDVRLRATIHRIELVVSGNESDIGHLKDRLREIIRTPRSNDEFQNKK